MKNQHKNNVWTGVEELTNDPAFQQMANREFNEEPMQPEDLMDQGASRRDFLKYLGFGLGAATLAAGCDIPVKRAIPYVIKPDEIVPGVATYYASSFVQGGDYCSVLVKTREGRPIKIEGNSLSSVTMGGTSARAQASVLSLYDNNRIDGPYRVVDGKVEKRNKRDQGPGWEAIDKEITEKLNANSRIRLVGHTNMSPTTERAIKEFIAAYPNTEVVIYDPVSSSALLDANEECFGRRVVPAYHFDKADVIVSLEADFLGTWVSPVEFAAQYVKNRKVKDVHSPKMSRHIQVESHMSLTGSNADNRILMKPSEIGAAVAVLYNEVAGLVGQSRVSAPALSGEKVAKLQKVAKELVDARGRALVVSGSNNVGEQVLVNALNAMLDSYGATIDFANASMQRKGSDQAIRRLVRDMNAGQVDALFVMDGANPAWDIPNADEFVAGMAKVGLKVAFSGTPNETAMACDYLTPTHHYLESWGDVQPKAGHYSLIQPTIAPLFRTRQTEESLLTWAGSENLDPTAEQPMYDYLKKHWEEAIFPMQDKFAVFQSFWDSTLHDGVFEKPEQAAPEFGFAGNVAAAASRIRKPSNSEMEISFFETVNVGNGVYADNPWLMEMPDPIARTVWANHLAVPVMWEGGNSFKSLNDLNRREAYGEADIVEVTVGENTLRVPALRQFGQMRGTVSLALGYGRKLSGIPGKAMANDVGVNVYPMLTIDANGNTQYYAESVSVSEKVGTENQFACVQYHHTMGVNARDENGELMRDEKTGEVFNVDEKTVMTLGAGFQGGLTDRSIIYKANLKEVEELAHHIEEKRAEAKKLNEHTLYPFEEYSEKFYSQGHHWAMHIDLNACIGCGACQVACVAENNVPVVGKKEVSRHHEMTWLRIDRYYFGDYENPNVVYQPMMCQHCDNAPCENVCPVNATNHSSEGLNQMSYNRCIGTRYCANNCPYKVRRFNWLDYTTADLFPLNETKVNGEDLPFGADNLTRMILNPDVTVRSRGVIEKCSFCVQRLQEGKLTAKREGRALRDNDVKTACQTACPTGAIVFGDRNLKDGVIAERMDNPLNYLVLEETNTQSAVNYSAKIVNRSEELDA